MKIRIDKEFNCCLDCPFSSMEFLQNDNNYTTDENYTTMKTFDFSNCVYVCLYSNRYIPNQCLTQIADDCPLVIMNPDFITVNKEV